MKKIFLMTFVSIFAVSAAFAQVKNVKKAYKLSEAYENPDFDQAETLIEEALTDPTTKDDPYTWWVAGHIQDRKIAWENEKLASGQSADRDLQNEAAYKAYDYFLKSTELEKLPDAKGKISDKLTKKISATLAWYYKNFLIFNHGLKSAEYEDYNTTINALTKHLAIVDLPFMQNYKGNSDAPKPVKDTTYYKIKYYQAIYTSLAGKNDEAITQLEALKNKGYKENEVYQYLYNLYRDKKDSVNMMKILSEGIERFPNEVVFLGLTINVYLEKGKKQDALNMLNKAIERNPSNAEYYTIRGQINRDLGNADAALKDYDKAISLNPKKTVYYYNKGEFLYYKGVDLYAVAANTKNPADASRLKAQVKQYLGEAKENFNKALQIDEKDVQSLRMLRNIATQEDNQPEYNRLSKRIKELE